MKVKIFVFFQHKSIFLFQHILNIFFFKVNYIFNFYQDQYALITNLVAKNNTILGACKQFLVPLINN